uniref:TonB-linked outer membrane receptor n=1 Tax=uncultured bacterium 4C6 TaxID=1701323 RepID=A0A0N9HT95_9BACT|nr:tonB-linked outer membrane receptor [uncultured bacterium 4C6]
MNMRIIIYLFGSLFISVTAAAQNGILKGRITSGNGALPYVNVVIDTIQSTNTNDNGLYELSLVPGSYEVTFSMIGYVTEKRKVTITSGATTTLNIALSANTSKLDEVVVTGVSRRTQLRSNPVPIAVMTKKEMDENVNNNIIDAIVKGVPGVSAVTTGPNISKPFIRGLGYNRVLTLYDGIRQEGQQWGDEHGIEIDQYGIGRAEVIKGPASLTYGSDALAGVINMIPYVPTGLPNKVLQGNYIADYHTNNGMIGTSLGLTYKKDDWKYSFRATGKLAHDYRNKVDGYVYNTGFREYNFSGLARTDKKWGHSQIAATFYDNKQEIPDGSRNQFTRRFTKQIFESDVDDITNRPEVTDSELKSYKIAPLHQHIQHYRVYTNNQFNLGDSSSISASLAFQQSVRREYNHPTQVTQAALYLVLNTLNYDLKYNLPTIAGIESSVGVNGMYQTNRTKDATDFAIPDYNLFDAGAFFFAKKTMGKVDISGGLRYDNRHIKWDDFYVGPNPQNGFEQRVSATSPGAKLQFPSFTHTYQGVSGSLGLTYNISQRLLFKANIARGYRAPNITEIGSNGLDPGAHIVYLGNRNFNPEFSLQQDIGMIAYLKDVDLVLELFNNNIENYIYQSKLTDANGDPVIIVPGNTTYQYQQSSARLYGVEFTFNIHPQAAKWVTFNNSIAYVKGLNGNKQLIAQSNGAAKYLPFIPPLHTRSELKFNLQKNYGAWSKIYFKAELDNYAAQNNFYALDNTETATSGYSLVNLGAGATISKKSEKTLCELFLQVDNLFNVAYQSNLNRLKYFEYYTTSPNGRSGIYNIGRNVSVKVIFPF